MKSGIFTLITACTHNRKDKRIVKGIKMNKKEFDKRIEKFVTALRDLYLDADEREGAEMPKIELEEENLTDDFTAMIIAVHLLSLIHI